MPIGWQAVPDQHRRGDGGGPRRRAQGPRGFAPPAGALPGAAIARPLAFFRYEDAFIAAKKYLSQRRKVFVSCRSRHVFSNELSASIWRRTSNLNFGVGFLELDDLPLSQVNTTLTTLQLGCGISVEGVKHMCRASISNWSLIKFDQHRAEVWFFSKSSLLQSRSHRTTYLLLTRERTPSNSTDIQGI